MAAQLAEGDQSWVRLSLQARLERLEAR